MATAPPPPPSRSSPRPAGDVSNVRAAPPPPANRGNNNNGNANADRFAVAAVAIAAPAAVQATATPTNTASTELELLRTLTRERRERSADMAQHQCLIQSLNRGLSSALADNAALRRLLADRDEELLLLEAKLAVCGDGGRRAYLEDTLRRWQEALLGLHHARSCTVASPSVCPVEDCGGYKRLLRHVRSCTSASCPTLQCRTASCLLRHSARCESDACPLCRPLKEAIRLEEAALTIASLRHGAAATSGSAAVCGRAMARAPTAAASSANGATHRARDSHGGGSVAPAVPPKRGENGPFQRPSGRGSEGMDWDGVHGRHRERSDRPPAGDPRQKEQQQQPMEIEPPQSQAPQPPEVRQPSQYQYHPTPAAAAAEKTQRRVPPSPLVPINPNRPTTNSPVSRSTEKKGSVAMSLLSQTRPRRDSDSLPSSTSRARFAQQLQSRDESAADSEASSSIDTRASSNAEIISVGIISCEACLDRGGPSIQMCQDCKEANLSLLLHASTCRNVACTVVHCGDMKMRLQHIETCDTGFVGGCRMCRYIFPLLRLHALQCPLDNCTLPSCASLKSCANCNGDSILFAKQDGEVSRPSLCETCQAVLPPALLHSTNCSGTCDLPHCDQMSAHIAHWMACPDGLSCCVCRRYTAIVRGHAIDCTDPKCGVTSCGAAKTSLFRASLFRASI